MKFEYSYRGGQGRWKSCYVEATSLAQARDKIRALVQDETWPPSIWVIVYVRDPEGYFTAFYIRKKKGENCE